MKEIDKVASKVVKFYSDKNFKNILEKRCKEIENILNEFIDEQESLKISRKIISRLKGEDSLREKLYRKNYIEIFKDIYNDESKVQQFICENIPDLIGFRINCYFKEDEIQIFKKLLDFLKNKNFIEIESESEMNNTQKNGHEIYKVACKYKEMSNMFSFEVQVKSLIHDVWSEVEHQIIYKNKYYDSRDKLKKDVIEGIYIVLDGVDKQLNKLYSFKNSIKEIKRELFFEYTKQEIDCKYDILGDHYMNFFKLISFLDGSQEHIDSYLGNKLLKSDFNKIKIKNQDIDIDKYTKCLDKQKWNVICKISRILYEFDDEESLLKNIICEIRKTAKDNLDDCIYESEVSEDDYDIREENNIDIIMISLSCILEDSKKTEV